MDFGPVDDPGIYTAITRNEHYCYTDINDSLTIYPGPVNFELLVNGDPFIVKD